MNLRSYCRKCQVGQKIHSGFSIGYYGKTQMNFLVNPMLATIKYQVWLNLLSILYCWISTCIEKEKPKGNTHHTHTHTHTHTAHTHTPPSAQPILHCSHKSAEQRLSLFRNTLKQFDIPKFMQLEYYPTASTKY